MFSWILLSRWIFWSKENYSLQLHKNTLPVFPNISQVAALRNALYHTSKQKLRVHSTRNPDCGQHCQCAHILPFTPLTLATHCLIHFLEIKRTDIFKIRIRFWNYGSFRLWQNSLAEAESAPRKACTTQRKKTVYVYAPKGTEPRPLCSNCQTQYLPYSTLQPRSTNQLFNL